MSVITDYKVIIQGQFQIDGVVKASIKNGWHPHGGVTVRGTDLAQAMVKVEE